MPEAAAIALSQDPRVLYVYENGIGTLFQTTQQPPLPWGLDRIDQIGPVDTNPPPNGLTNGTYTYPNDGAGVHVYVIDTGIFTHHNQFKITDTTYRASVAVDKVDDDSNPNTPPESDGNGADGFDCNGHGTLVASIIGGNSPVSGENSYGVAKGVTLHSVRAVMNPTPTPSPSPAPTPARPCAGGDAIVDEEIKGIDWVAANATKPAVANMSFGCYGYNPLCNQAVQGAVAAGVTMVAAAGNYSKDGANGRDASLESPASEPLAITVGSSNAGESRQSQTNFGSLVDVFAPGSTVPGATIGGPSATTVSGGTSLSAPHVVGVAAMYLYDHPNGTASLPWVVQQVIKSNANICRYEDQVDQIAPCYPSTVGRVAGRPAGTNTPDRLLNMSFLTEMPANPIDNQRFFVWQHYADFKPGGKDEPDEQGLEFWTRNITGNPRLSTGCGLDRSNVNTNNSCTHDWRINTSLAFWVDKHPELFTTGYGLTSGNNSQFVKLCYSIYLKFDDADQRDPNGFGFWKGVLDSYGDPASPTGVRVLIDQFLNSTGPGVGSGPPGYRVRFGAS